MAQNGTSLCYLVVVVVSIIFLIWGFVDLLRVQQAHEHKQTQVISRQLRGLGLIFLSQVILVLGAALCFGLSGGRWGAGGLLGGRRGSPRGSTSAWEEL